MVGEYVKMKIDNEIKECQVLSFAGWDRVDDNNKSTLILKPYFLGYKALSWPSWLEALFSNNVFELCFDLCEDTPSLIFHELTTIHNVEERDVILRYKTNTGDIQYKYMSRKDYDAADKEEYKEVKF